MPGFIIFVLFLLLVAGVIVISSLYVVKQQSVAIIERCGRYQKISDSGIHMRAPFGIDKIAARVQLRVLQSEIVVETKTQDNVFVTMNVATQYRVNESNVKDAYYKLMRPESQIKSYIEDALRSSVPKLTLDELFEKKDEIALEVQKQVAEEMSTYGYIIVKTLITKVEPDAEVKQSMNEINAAQRKRVAAQELAEADKIKIVTAAEAEAEKEAAILRAEAKKEAMIREAEGRAQAIEAVQRATAEGIRFLNEADPSKAVLTIKSLEAFEKAADGKATKIIIPSEIQGVAGLAKAVVESVKETE